jgi:hypothetical protein
MVGEIFNHFVDPALMEEGAPSAFNHDTGHGREGVECRSDAAKDQHEGEGFPGTRQRMYFAEPDGCDRRDGHVQRVPHTPSLDHNVTTGASDQYRDQQNDGPAGTLEWGMIQAVKGAHRSK